MNLAELNQINHEFWSKETALMYERLVDPGVAVLAAELWSSAIAILPSDRPKKSPIQYKPSYEIVLRDAQKYKNILVTELARTAGRRKRTDALQAAIQRIVSVNPKISEKRLLKLLPKEFEVREGAIIFANHDGSHKQVPVSGLKDRLSRVKKSLAQSG